MPTIMTAATEDTRDNSEDYVSSMSGIDGNDEGTSRKSKRTAMGESVKRNSMGNREARRAERNLRRKMAEGQAASSSLGQSTHPAQGTPMTYTPPGFVFGEGQKDVGNAMPKEVPFDWGQFVAEQRSQQEALLKEIQILKSQSSQQNSSGTFGATFNVPGATFGGQNFAGGIGEDRFGTRPKDRATLDERYFRRVDKFDGDIKNYVAWRFDFLVALGQADMKLVDQINHMIRLPGSKKIDKDWDTVRDGQIDREVYQTYKG